MVDQHDETPESLGERPAAPTSALTGLRARRQQVVAALYVDYAVPRYDPPIFVRFRPISDARMTAINKQADKSKDPEKQVVANAVALAECCVGVFEQVTEDGETRQVSVDHDNPSTDPEDWPRFDQRLAELLGLDTSGPLKAADVVRGLYATDGDVLATAGKVAEWSGYSLQGVEEREGN